MKLTNIEFFKISHFGSSKDTIMYWRYMIHHILDKNLYPELLHNSYKSTVKRQRTQLKMGKEF